MPQLPEKPRYWATNDDFELLMRRLQRALDSDYLDRNDPEGVAAQTLIYAWRAGTVRVLKPAE